MPPTQVDTVDYQGATLHYQRHSSPAATLAEILRLSPYYRRK
jgi:hypothetical protein